MCIAIPGTVLSLNSHNAIVNINGVETEVNRQLVPNLRMNDHVLIHSGCIIEKINVDYFDFLEEAFKRLMDEDRNE